MLPTATTPAVVRASTIRALLRSALGDRADLPRRYTVSSVGLYDGDGVLIECDTSDFYRVLGAAEGENIDIGATTFEITRYGVVENDLS
jgi:hypothetical protein